MYSEPSRTSKMQFFAHVADFIQTLTIFAKQPILGVSEGKCPSDKTKQKLVSLSVISQKIRTAISAYFFYF